MILAIDIGNTNIVMGCVDGKQIIAQRRITTQRTWLADSYVPEMRRVLREAGLDPKSFAGAIFSSVVPEIDREIRLAVEKLTGLVPMEVRPEMKCGFSICIDDPATLAPDIITGVAGAMRHYPLPLAVVDMGTATTIVVVDRQSQYLGGCIIPGVRLSLSALANTASLLPAIDIAAPEQVICGRTVDAMQSGVVFGSAVQLDGMVERMEEELGDKLTVVATGGLAGCIVPHCKRDVAYEPDLLLLGLAALYELNQ